MAQARLSDTLDMAEWQRRRDREARGEPLSRAASGTGGPSDGMSIAAWNMARNRQVSGGLALAPKGSIQLTAAPAPITRQAQAGLTPVAAGRRQLDPSRTDVFRRGPDGKLQSVPGWHTTGPFEAGKWAHNVDWGGVGDDLVTIIFGAAGGVTAAGKTFFERLALAGGLYAAGKETLKDLQLSEPPKR